jgi:2-succinyl-6-hydroxy-2,4-cyclohexadiene-1-carboxylate synthase
VPRRGRRPEHFLIERLHSEAHEGRGPFLLLVHGVLSGRSQWQPNLLALSETARPVVVELWGHGRSPSPEDPELYTPGAYVRAFEAVREELGADRWCVCGQSLGAALTLRYALDHPERVIAQVFTNSLSALADEEWAARTRAAAPALADAIAEGGREAIERMPIHPAHARRIPPAAHRALLEDAARLDPQGVARTFRHTIPDSSVRARVAANRVPSLLVCGERETRFKPHREFAERAMSHLEVVALDGGHAVNLEAAAAFDQAVCAFLGRLARRCRLRR